MTRRIALAAFLLAFAAPFSTSSGIGGSGLGSAAAAPAACADGGLGVARVIQIDTRHGPLYGEATKFARQADFLGSKEVVLTFDDGPMPWITRAILDSLDRFCTKATFFSVGRMALAYPDVVREVAARGHTLGTHTWSHPMSLRRLRPDAAIGEIERGFAAVASAAGQPIAPFFRFPGLNDSGPLLNHLQSRGIATFTVDIVSNDSYIANSDRLVRETIAKVEARQGGIILFHDIKASTARALPAILGELKARGYRIVHMTAKQPVIPDQRMAAEFGAQLARAGSTRRLVPFYGTAGPQAAAAEKSAGGDTPVTYLAPAARAFEESRAANRPSPAQVAASDGSGWVTTVRRQRPRTRAPM